MCDTRILQNIYNAYKVGLWSFHAHIVVKPILQAKQTIVFSCNVVVNIHLTLDRPPRKVKHWYLFCDILLRMTYNAAECCLNTV